MGKEIGHEIITWDPKQNAYSTIVVGNSFPDANIGTSKWDGNNLVIVHDFEFNGAIFHLRSTITKTGENTVHVEEISQYAECATLLRKANAVKK